MPCPSAGPDRQATAPPPQGVSDVPDRHDLPGCGAHPCLVRPALSVRPQLQPHSPRGAVQRGGRAKDGRVGTADAPPRPPRTGRRPGRRRTHGRRLAQQPGYGPLPLRPLPGRLAPPDRVRRTARTPTPASPRYARRAAARTCGSSPQSSGTRGASGGSARPANPAAVPGPGPRSRTASTRRRGKPPLGAGASFIRRGLRPADEAMGVIQWSGPSRGPVGSGTAVDRRRGVIGMKRPGASPKAPVTPLDVSISRAAAKPSLSSRGPRRGGRPCRAPWASAPVPPWPRTRPAARKPRPPSRRPWPAHRCRRRRRSRGAAGRG